MNNKTIILTFDYELFSKRSGSVDSCILKPVGSLQNSFSKFNIRAVFFVDAVFLIRIREETAFRDEYKKIKDQLLSLLDSGHRIELHLHPHWFFSTLDGNNFFIKDFKHFNIMNFSDEEIRKFFHSGYQILQEIANEQDPDYHMVAYRGGGWCIQPFEKLRSIFSDTGIFIDSTVARGFKMINEYQYYDFSTTPDKPYYFFENDPTQEVTGGSLVEVPITTYRLSLIRKIRKTFLKCKYKKKEFMVFGDGEGLSQKDFFPGKHKENWIEKYFANHYMYSLQNMIPPFFMELLKSEHREIINMISHPKNLTPLSFDVIRDMVETGKVTFMTLEELYKKTIRDHA